MSPYLTSFMNRLIIYIPHSSRVWFAFCEVLLPVSFLLLPLLLPIDSFIDSPFCNRIAAKILVPYVSFNEQWNLHTNDYDTLENFFKVSQLVLYRMALVYGKIDDKEYKRLVAIYDKKYQENKNNESSGGGDFYNTSPYKAGRSFCKYLREALTEGKISYGEAYQLLGVKGNTFENVMKSAVEGRK